MDLRIWLAANQGFIGYSQLTAAIGTRTKPCARSNSSTGAFCNARGPTELEPGGPKVRGISQEEEQNETPVSSIAQMPALNDSIILSELAVDQRGS